MKIYLDILLIGNFLLTELCLKLLSVITKQRIRRGRMISAGTVSALSSLIIIISPQNVCERILLMLAKLAISVLITAIAVGLRDRLHLLRCSIIYTVSDIMLCGVCAALWELTGARVFVVKNCTVYLDIPIWLVIVCSCTAYIILTVYDKLLTYSFAVHKTYKAVYSLGEYSCTLPAVCDSGNLLRDPFSGEPVVVFSSAKVFSALGLDNEQIYPSKGFHFVQYNTVSETNLMPVTSKGTLDMITSDGKCIRLHCPVGFVKNSEIERAVFHPRLIIL